jgi:NitT/TauT family transport system permease protein
MTALSRVRNLLWPFSLILACLGTWEGWVRVGHVSRYITVAPSAVVMGMVDGWHAYANATLATGKEIAGGFLLAVIFGLGLALLIDASATLAGLIYPMLIASQVVPVVAVAPLLVVWFGFGSLSKIMTAFLYGFFPVVVSAVTGLESLQREKVYFARSTGAGAARTLRKIALPHALPYIFGGLKLAATFSVIGAVLGEFLGSSSGLGYMLLIANGNLDTLSLLCALGYLSLVGVAIWALVSFLERLAIPWHVSQRSAATSSAMT